MRHSFSLVKVLIFVHCENGAVVSQLLRRSGNSIIYQPTRASAAARRGFIAQRGFRLDVRPVLGDGMRQVVGRKAPILPRHGPTRARCSMSTFAFFLGGETHCSCPSRQWRRDVWLGWGGDVLEENRRRQQVPGDRAGANLTVTVYLFNAAKRARNACGIECEQR